MTARERIAGNVANYVDERTGAAAWMKKNLNKVFPDHWSFLLGEIALYSFIILLLSGTFLTFWFDPSQREVVYEGSYQPLAGLEMSAAYASTLHISFEVRGGLLMRQIHHWAALFFMVAIVVHLMRVYFTGAFRKPREFNWIIGVGLLTLGIVEGFLGYSLPDDLLSGTGIRIAEAIIQAIPVVGNSSTNLSLSDVALVDATGSDTRELAAACSQIAFDTNAGKAVIDEEDISKYYQGRVEATGFDVADATIDGNLPVALITLRSALETGTDPVMVTSAIASSLRSMAKVSGTNRGVKSFELAGQLGMAPWQIDKARRQLQSWTPRGIATAVEAIAKADADVKGASSDPIYALEKAVRTIAAARSAR